MDLYGHINSFRFNFQMTGKVYNKIFPAHDRSVCLKIMITEVVLLITQWNDIMHLLWEYFENEYECIQV